MVLASFAAEFTVLVVVNFAVLFIAQRNYEPEEKRMSESLILEADKRDTTETRRADAEIVKFGRVLSKRGDERIDPIKTEQKELRGFVRDLQQHTFSHYKSMASPDERMAAETAKRQREEGQIAATEADREGHDDQAAMYLTHVVKSEMGVEYGGVSPSNFSGITASLERIDQSKWISDSGLTFMLKTLTAGQSLEELTDADAGELARGIEIIEGIRERQNQQIADYPVPSPTMPLRMPRTAPEGIAALAIAPRCQGVTVRAVAGRIRRRIARLVLGGGTFRRV